MLVLLDRLLALCSIHRRSSALRRILSIVLTFHLDQRHSKAVNDCHELFKRFVLTKTSWKSFQDLINVLFV